MKKILVCGSRDWHYAEPIREALQGLLEFSAAQNIMIIHGGARGADTIAGDIGKQLGMAVARVDANWDYYHKAAGAIRNKWMVLLEPDYVLGFPTDINTSRGTKNMIELAKRRETDVRVYLDGQWWSYIRDQGAMQTVSSPWRI